MSVSAFPMMPWIVTSCDACQFKVVRFQGPNPGQDYFTQVLVSKKPNHECLYFPKTKKIPKITSDDLPKVQFSKFDQVVQRRFYEVCYPVIRKKLWLTSKKSSNLGKKPTTFIVKYVYSSGHIFNWNHSPFDGNSVFDLRFFFNSNSKIENLKPVVEFNHLHLHAASLDSSTTKLLCHPNVLSAVIENNHLDLKTVVKMMPNLKSCAFYNNLGEEWEKTLLKLPNKPRHLHLKPNKITNFRALHHFLLIQKSDASLTLTTNVGQFDQKKLSKFFVPWTSVKGPPTLEIRTPYLNSFHSLS